MYLNALPIGSGGESRKIQERGNAFLFGEKIRTAGGSSFFGRDRVVHSGFSPKRGRKSDLHTIMTGKITVGRPSLLYARPIFASATTRESGLQSIIHSKKQHDMKKQFMMIGFFLVAMLAGCSHDESTQAVDSRQTNVSAEFVSADEAKTIAAAVQFGSAETGATGSQATTRSASLDKKDVLNVTPVAETTGSTAFYVINYEGGGFMILSADKRVDPVLAYSETSTFPMNDPKGLPDGLVDWMTETKAYIQDVRMKNEPLTEEMKMVWESSSIQAMLEAPNNHRNSDNPRLEQHQINECELINPLLNTVWHGGLGYNNLAPMMGCSEYSNGRAPAGCVAVAMAQVMKYYQYPHSYNWSAMPDRAPSMETAKLMRDIGDAIHMNYNCSGSSAYCNVAALAFIYAFHYPSVKYARYDPDLVKRDLRARRPVILNGGENINGHYSNGHAWVCDGYQKIIIRWEHIIEFLHMNWGWSDYEPNGWYSLYTWRPGRYIQDYNPTMIYEIMP